jgi:peptide-methionine (S)-S-oxide reductase
MTRIKMILLTASILFGLVLHHGAAEARTIKSAVFAGGCFWCVEADFDKIAGVIETTSGYTGGKTANPTYKQVTAGGTGHYEAVMVRYDADVVSFRTLVDAFLRRVDPTDAGGQFCDRGDSYRTAIFVRGKAERDAAEAAVADANRILGGRVVTPVVNAGPFYKAEGYHQDYYLGEGRVLTRFGYVKQKDAYKGYREGCGRDARIRAVWGAEAFKGL